MDIVLEARCVDIVPRMLLASFCLSVLDVQDWLWPCFSVTLQYLLLLEDLVVEMINNAIK